MSPIEIVQTYFDRVYGDLEVDALRELCSDPYRRHEAGHVDVLDHEQQVERVNRAIAGARSADGRTFTFTTVLMSGDDDMVSVVFDMSAPDDSPMASAGLDAEHVDGEIRMCGIELFRVQDGLITDVWNSTLMPGHWG